MFEIIVLFVSFILLVYIIALLIRAFANKNHICPICKQKVGMNSIKTRDNRVVCLKCCKKAGIQLHNTESYHTLEEIKEMLRL